MPDRSIATPPPSPHHHHPTAASCSLADFRASNKKLFFFEKVFPIPNGVPFRFSCKSQKNMVPVLPSSMNCFVLIIFACLLHSPIDAQTASGCALNCNGHGTCDTSGSTPTYKCACYDGWGGANDIADYKSPDCTSRELGLSSLSLSLSPRGWLSDFFVFSSFFIFSSFLLPSY